jgi:hypothetical protein
MFRRIVTVMRVLVRIATILGIMYLTTLLTTSVRDDTVGLVVGLVFGLIFGYIFVYFDWARLEQ